MVEITQRWGKRITEEGVVTVTKAEVRVRWVLIAYLRGSHSTDRGGGGGYRHVV